MIEEGGSMQINASDIIELNEAVDPWQLRMQQISPGDFQAQIKFAPINGLLVNQEYWSKKIFAVGTSPPEFFMIAGPRTPKPFLWCGAQVTSQQLACNLTDSEIEFVTPNGTDHWVILVPKEKFRIFLGEELAADMPLNQHVLQCLPAQCNALQLLVDFSLAQFKTDEHFLENTLLLDALEYQLLSRIAEVLGFSQSSKGCQTERKRYIACKKAALYAEKLQGPIRLSELARAAGTSERVLQLGFRELYGITPGRFLRWSRLNRLHRDLYRLHAHEIKVTEIMERYGFLEFGRTAVDYRNLFGDHPSQTLTERAKSPFVRLADALHF